MDIIIFLQYALAVLETACLIGALVYSARAFKKNPSDRDETMQKKYRTTAVICLSCYLVLNLVRRHFLPGT